MLLNWILGMLMPAAPGQNSVSGFILFVLQIVILVGQLFLVGRARRYALEAERHEMRTEEQARAAERSVEDARPSRRRL